METRKYQKSMYSWEKYKTTQILIQILDINVKLLLESYK